MYRIIDTKGKTIRDGFHTFLEADNWRHNDGIYLSDANIERYEERDINMSVWKNGNDDCEWYCLYPTLKECFEAAKETCPEFDPHKHLDRKSVGKWMTRYNVGDFLIFIESIHYKEEKLAM